MTEGKLPSKKRIILNSFLGGVAWGVGTVIGATLIVTLIIWLLGAIGWIAVIGDLASEIIRTIEKSPLK